MSQKKPTGYPAESHGSNSHLVDLPSCSGNIDLERLSLASDTGGEDVSSSPRLVRYLNEEDSDDGDVLNCEERRVMRAHAREREGLKNLGF